MKNYNEIIEVLKNAENSDFSEFADGDFPDELGETEEVFSQGGEGEGENWKRVYHFKDHNVFIEFSGFYTSYDGTSFESEWDGDVKEVKPAQKTITVYE